MSELFPVSEVAQDSPRLAWLKQHGLETAFDAGWTVDMQESPETGETVHPWACYRLNCEQSSAEFLRESGFGASEAEAILDYCANNKIRHWTLDSA